MLHRIEISPTQQLEGLRKARDYYVALADAIHSSPPDPSEPEAEHMKREQEARRIAAAYQKSFNIQNVLLGGGREQA